MREDEALLCGPQPLFQLSTGKGTSSFPLQVEGWEWQEARGCGQRKVEGETQDQADSALTASSQCGLAHLSFLAHQRRLRVVTLKG